jgi:nitrogen fixation protein NifB
MNTDAALRSRAHPCFSREASGSCGRVHLPIAPGCNIQCNYCNRRHDCVNESRPGVTSAILTPRQALEYTKRVLDTEPRITVVGIAGPGDPLANPHETLETLRLIRAEFPHLLFCLSSNGLAMPEYVADLAALGLSHATITMSTVDPGIGARIYAWVREGNTVHRGQDAAELLLARQLESLAALKAHGLVVKVNAVMIPGVNTSNDCAPLKAVAEKASELGVDLMNVISVLPTAGTPFEGLVEPAKEDVATLRRQIGHLVPQMTHCRRCRADAVGLLCADRSGELGDVLAACAKPYPQDREASAPA